MKEIPLRHGKTLIVDDEDFARVNAHRWYAWKSKSTWYARRNVPRPARAAVYLHRWLLDLGPDEHVDHVNGDGLDNRRANLRPATPQQNSWNTAAKRGGRSRFKGVIWDSSRGKWIVRVQRGPMVKHIGVFVDEHTAARAYDAAAREHFGAFARLNFPDQAPHA